MVRRKSRAVVVTALLYLVGSVLTVGAQQQGSPLPVREGREQALALLSERIGDVVRIRTASGGEFTGKLYRLLEDRVEIVNAEGEIVQIAADEIASALVIDQGKDGGSYYEDSASNRLIVMPTGFGMQPGELHIAVQEIVAVTASYGMSSHVSLWGGISIPGALVNARFSMPLGKSAAISSGSFLGLSWFEFLGIAMPYVIGSIGTPTQNFTFGAAMPVVADSEGVRIGGVVAGLAGKIVLSRTAAIVTENWVILSADRGAWDGTPFVIIPSVAFRIAGSRFSWDVGAVIPLVIDDEGGGLALSGFPFGEYFVPIPIISLTYRIK